MVGHVCSKDASDDGSPSLMKKKAAREREKNGAREGGREVRREGKDIHAQDTQPLTSPHSL
jgi:hypothetical protein